MDQLIVGPHFFRGVSRSPNSRQPAAHVFLERDYRCGKILVERCVHSSRQRVVHAAPADLKNVQVIGVK
jgi:hypothetical protein